MAGYGSYSYSTDKTKGHVQQYYVDKFRVASDFGRGLGPSSNADAMLGRTAKGQMIMPEGGVPQPIDPLLLADMTDVPPDPRIAESEGLVWSWDNGFVDPANSADTYADVDDEEVSTDAFSSFFASGAAERKAVLAEMNAAQKHRVEKINDGLSESYLLTVEGQYEANYARLQNIKNIVMWNPQTGRPLEDIPGFPYLPSVGALDFMKVKARKSVQYVDTKAKPRARTAELPAAKAAKGLLSGGK
jgi:hypothetical protein